MRPLTRSMTLLVLLFSLPAMARNHAPAPTPLSLTTDEDVKVEGVAAATDEDGDPLAFRLLGNPAHGQASVKPDGHLSYTPQKNFHGDDVFTVEVSDGKKGARWKVVVRVAPANDAPVARPVSLSTREDVEARGACAVSDVDGDALRFRVLTGPAHGTAQVDPHSGALSYQPAPDTSGPDAFSVEASDGALTTTFGVAVTVAPVNDAPRAVAGTFTGDEDSPLTGTVTARDVDGDPLTFKLKTRPKFGELQLDPRTGAFTYLPRRDVNGPDSFSFEVSDGALRAEAVAALDVRPVNDAPSLQPLSLTTTEDAPRQGKLVARDVDSGLSFSLRSPAAHGEARVDSRTGAVSYQPAPDFNGVDTFSVEASDGALTALAEVKVAVSAVNDAPVAPAATHSLQEDVPFDGKVVATDVDVDALVFSLAQRPAHGMASVDSATGALRFVPSRDFNGDDSCTIEVSDGKAKVTAAVTFRVAAVNDAPVLAPLSLATREDSVAQGKLVASDVDSALSFTVTTRPAHGEASLDARTGALTFRPGPDFNGADAFTVEVSDGALTASAEVKVAVAAVNDAPVAPAVSLKLDEDGRLEAPIAASDVDGDPLTWTLTAGPAHGTAALDPGTGKLTYAPAKDYFGDDTLTIEVSDRQLKAVTPVRVQVVAVNDAPVVRPLALAAPEDTPTRGAVIAADVDSPLFYRVSQAPQHGEARVDPRGAVTWQPAADFNGSDAFIIEVSDGALRADCLVSVAISAVNDAPVLPASAFTAEEDRRLEVQLPQSDVDGDALSTRLLQAPAHGVATVEAATGKVSFLPAKDFNGDDQLSVEVSDGKLKTTSVVTVRVLPLNDAPTASPLSLSTSEDTACRGAVAAGDVDRDALRYRVLTPPRHGQAGVDAATGAVSYAPAADSHGPDSFELEVSDGALTATSAVTVAVAPVDDPPVVREATLELSEDVPAEGRLPATEADGERLTWRLLSTPRLGVATLLDSATGAVRFTPGADLNGDDEVRFDVTDGKTTVPGTLKLHVGAVNDAPTLSRLELTTDEDQAIEGQLVAKDVDGDALTFSLVAASPRGAGTVDTATGRVRFVPARDANGRAVFRAGVSDGKLGSAPAEVTIAVTPQNDSPVAADGRFTTDEDEVLTGTLQAADVDGDPLAFAVVAEPAHGQVLLTGDRFEYTPAPNYAGEDSFGFTATDAAGTSSRATVRVTIKEVNDAPVAVSESIVAPFRGTISGRLKGFDRETRQVTFRLLGKPSNGELRLVDPRTGEFTISTEGRSTDESTVRFEVDDGSLKSVPGELVVQIRSL